MTLEQALRIANDSLLELEGVDIMYYMARNENEEAREAVSIIKSALEDTARTV